LQQIFTWSVARLIGLRGHELRAMWTIWVC